MSSNIFQIFEANPITTNESGDLMYFGRSPYGNTDDTAMLFSSFSAQFSPSALTSSHIFVGNSSNVATDVPLSGDATLANTGALTLATVNPDVGTFQGITVNAKGLVTGAVNENYLPNTLTQNDIFVGNSSNVATGVAMSGDATIVASGALTLATVNTNTGSFGSATQVASFTVNGKGLITAASNVAITGIISPVNQTTSTATLTANDRYITNNGATLVTYTLPTTPTVGDTYIILGGSSGGWTVHQNASQQIHLGSSSTTSGTGGSLSSSLQYDCVTITALSTTSFVAYNVQGNLTVV